MHLVVNAADIIMSSADRWTDLCCPVTLLPKTTEPEVIKHLFCLRFTKQKHWKGKQATYDRTDSGILVFVYYYCQTPLPVKFQGLKMNKK